MLHGFLGSGNDFPDADLGRSQLRLNLPGHGRTQPLSNTARFEQLDNWLGAQLEQAGISNYWLLGYSLGGRIAMLHACRQQNQAKTGLCGVIIESAHPGLENPNEQQQRLAHDQHWAQQFETLPLPQVLHNWYQQPVFQDLSPTQQLQLVQQRLQNQPQQLADMLRSASLGNQPNLRPELAKLKIPCHYLVGNNDLKFMAIARTLPKNVVTHIFEDAGHNIHHGQPLHWLQTVKQIIRSDHVT